MTQDAKTFGMLCHLLALSMFIGIPYGNILGPLVIWLLKKDVDPFIDAQGKASLNFQISMAIFITICVLLSWLTCFITAFIAGILAILNIIFVILASIEANNGRSYTYPFAIRFIS